MRALPRRAEGRTFRISARPAALLLLALVLVAAAVLVVVELRRRQASLTPAETSTGAPAEDRARLQQLPVGPAASMAGYSRERFRHWSEAARFGWSPPRPDCSTRQAALVRDGHNVQVGDRCQVSAGTWFDPYTGKTFSRPSDVDIDHVVPLAAAWRAGANEWDDRRREQYANDPVVLLTVWDSANQEKGDKGPEVWKPPRREEWCDYARRWIAIKAKYGLAVIAPYQLGGRTYDERAALLAMLDPCGSS